MRRYLLAAAAGASVGLISAVAAAQDSSPPADTEEHVVLPAPKRAMEIGVEGGYTQPFGRIDNTLVIGDVASAGGAVGLLLGYRFTPHWSMEATGQFHESKVGDRLDGSTTDVRGSSVGMQGTYHFMPYGRVDPYASLGSGYRFMWVVPEGEGNTLLHGLEIVKAVFGVDIRATSSVALGPRIGATVDMFLARDTPGSADSSIDSYRPSTFVFAGLGGRFDVGGDRVPHERTAVPASRVTEPRPAPKVPPKTPPPAPEPTEITIDESIMQSCGIEKPKAYFDFDSARIRASDHEMLNKVAECFTTGPLKGRDVRVTGRADPRGTDEYNEKLGKSRAKSIGEYLHQKGLGEAKMNMVTKGEEEATGTDEESWQEDRRVDLELVK